MKIRPPILILVTFVVILIALILWRGSKKSDQMPLATTNEINAASVAGTQITNLVSSASVQAPPLPTLATNTTQLPNKWDQIKPILATANDQPIVFYGKVEDQFGNPIADAQIAADVKIYNGVQNTVERFSRKSDANGLFTISGYKGERLGLNVEKSGYVLVSISGSTIYSKLWPENQRAHPDQNNPTVIKMWKLQGAEPLVDISKEYKIPYSNQQINFGLLEKKIVLDGGDLKIILNRPDGIISEQHPQHWSINLEANDGGFIETSDSEASVTFAAPENGYQISGLFTNNNGIAWLNKDFFLKSRNGQIYSKFNLSVKINRTENDFMYIRFSGVANTNSSRNWEASVPQ